MSRPNPLAHPARFSESIIDLMAAVLMSEYPSFMGRPIVHDPFAGDGTALAEIARRADFYYMGTEIEPCFIINDYVMSGDSRDPSTYPLARRHDETMTGGWVVVTSPPYANGISDSHTPRDVSKRYTYTKAKIDLTGDPEAKLHEANLGRWGYRGSKRHGRSIRRQTYWQIADACVANWHTADLVLLNVSDFKSGGVIEPHVQDWRSLLAKHGYTDQLEIPVATPRMRNGENASERVDCEVIVKARRS